MHAAVADFGRRQDQEQLFNILQAEQKKLNITPAYLIELNNYLDTSLHLQESRRLLQEAYYLLKYEPDLLPEGKIAKTAKRNLMEMDMIIKKLCENAVTPL